MIRFEYDLPAPFEFVSLHLQPEGWIVCLKIHNPRSTIGLAYGSGRDKDINLAAEKAMTRARIMLVQGSEKRESTPAMPLSIDIGELDL